MKTFVSLIAVSALCVSAQAIAGDGFVTGDVELRAGPDPSYPSVSMLSNGSGVSIMGCVDNWSWCDVATPSDRGWIPGDFLQEQYDGQRVYVPEYAAQIGIPIVSFSFGSYWDSHYRNRSFYNERNRYVEVRPAYRAPTHQPHGGPGPQGHGQGPHPLPAQQVQPANRPPQGGTARPAAAMPAQMHPDTPVAGAPPHPPVNAQRPTPPVHVSNAPQQTHPAAPLKPPTEQHAAPANQQRTAPQPPKPAEQQRTAPQPAKPAPPERGKDDDKDHGHERR